MNIAILGKAGSGKTAVADYICKRYGYERHSIADQVKVIARDLFKMRGKDRLLLQLIGKKMREIKPNVWLDYTIQKVKGKDRIVIDDVRFPNEYEGLKAHGFVMVNVVADRQTCIDRLVRRDGEAAVDRLDDESETALDDVSVANVIPNNSTLDEMYLQVDKLMAELSKKDNKR